MKAENLSTPYFWTSHPIYENRFFFFFFVQNNYGKSFPSTQLENAGKII